MSESNIFIRHEDFDHYEQVLEDYSDGKVDHNRLVGERLLLGVYGQRQEGLCMVRTKLPGGRLSPGQLLGFADALEGFSGIETVHISTRQNIQFNDVPLEKTPDLLRCLATYGVTTREAGGNTVRNMTSCPMAGVCPCEHVDITPYLDAATRHFLRNPLCQSLPRKFKITFSGCEADCAQGMVQDLGVVATSRDGQFGFRLFAGGGLGTRPRQAIVLEDFLGEEDLLPTIEALLAMHDKYSDRERKARSRIKFLVEQFGPEGFVAKFREEFARTQAAFDEASAPRGRWRKAEDGEVCGPGAPRKILPQYQAGLHVVPIHVPGGNLNAEQLRGLRDLLDREGYGDLRATQDQNLAVFQVPADGVEPLLGGLDALGLGLPGAGSNVVACPGTATCQLGITSSQVAAQLLDGGRDDLVIRVNGCQNNCAHSDIADIGLYGKGKRYFGKLVPTYSLRLGGSGMAGGRFAFSGPDIPAARVKMAASKIQEAYRVGRNENETFSDWSYRMGAGYFDDLLRNLTQVREFELSTLLRDHGDEAVFRVESVGVGECAGAQADPVDKLLLEVAYEKNLRDAFAAKRKYEEAAESLDSIFNHMGQALLKAAGVEQGVSSSEDDLLGGVAEVLGEAETLSQEFHALRNLLDTWRYEQDELTYPELAARTDAWVKAARMQCRALQAKREKERKATSRVA